MGVTLLITAFDNSPFENGKMGFSGKSLNEINTIFPDFASLTIEAIDEAIGIFAKKKDDRHPAKKLKVQAFEKTAFSVIIHFSVESDLETSSGDMRRRVRSQFKKAGYIRDNQFLPLCCILTNDQVAAALNPTVMDELTRLQQRNDWLSIYQKFAPIEGITQNYPAIWSDAETLSTIGFASGKLAETASIPKEIFQDEQRKKDFLKQQARYRRETEFLRKRCLELEPDNPRYWSTLAYFYYQNVQELGQPKGRRDGNIREEIEKALEHYDKALSFDSSRIPDLYRKGYLLADVLPKQILFGKQGGHTESRSDLARQKIHQGITCLLQAIQIWESFSPSDEKQNEKRKRYRKEYIKSLYHAGCAYYELIINDWDEAVYALGLRKAISDSDKISYNSKDLENADNAWQYFYNCWLADKSDSVDISEQSLNKTPSIGAIEGVFRLYWLGKVLFARYWILSGYGQKDTPDSIESRNKAEIYLLAALKLAWSPESNRQNR